MNTRFKPKFNIKKGDLVIVITGSAKPKKDDSGKLVYKARKVLEVFPEKAKVLVEGANTRVHIVEPVASMIGEGSSVTNVFTRSSRAATSFETCAKPAGTT